METKSFQKYFKVISLVLIFIGLFPCIVNANTLELPRIDFLLESVSILGPVEPPLLRLNFKMIIYNPAPVPVTLRGFAFKEIFVGKELVDTDRQGVFEELIPSNETKTVEFSLDFPYFFEENREGKEKELLEGHWKFMGAVYFIVREEYFGVPLEWEGIKYPIYQYGYLPGPNSSTITVEVENEKGISISDAEVKLISEKRSFKVTTDKKGVAEFEVPTTNYTIRVSKEGYIAHEEPLELSIPSMVMRVIHLYPASKLIVEVKDGKGRPIENATITLSSKDFGNFTKITTASGIAEFEIPRANYTIKALKKGYLPYEETLDLSEVATSTKVIQLKLPFWQEYQYYIVGIVIFFIAASIVVMLLKRKRRLS